MMCKIKCLFDGEIIFHSALKRDTDEKIVLLEAKGLI